MTMNTAPSRRMMAAESVHRWCERLSFVFVNRARPIPIRSMPRTTNVSVSVACDISTGVPACHTISSLRAQKAY
jgi:hypothetical protein